MKRLICFIGLFLALWMCTLRADAPPFTRLDIVMGESINPFEPIWNAVCMVESRMDSTAYNSKDPHGGSHGIAQIGGDRLREYNKETGKHYTIKDLYKVSVSKEIFMYYAVKIGHHKMNLVIRKWNGSGPKTYRYLTLVKAHLPC